MTRVTLCVDALHPQPGGIGRYTWELYKGLSARGNISLSLYARDRVIADAEVLLRGTKLPRRRNVFQRWWETRPLRSSIVHGPNYFLPPFAEGGVVTVHDLSVFRFPETHPADRVRDFERKFLRSLKQATHIITDTETGRREVMDMFGVPPDTITAVPLGVDQAFDPRIVDPGNKVLRQWGLAPGQYGLCVSTLEPRKKITELLSAWLNLPRTLRDSFPLALCGGVGWRNEQLHALIRKGVGDGWLRHLGFVEEGALPYIYAGAALFVYPSIYEGFGLPPVEAMASGVPVLVSHHSCMPEVCGSAARYFDPNDADGFRNAIEACLGDPQWRADSSRLGVARARDFTWNRCIDGTVDIYRKAESG